MIIRLHFPTFLKGGKGGLLNNAVSGRGIFENLEGVIERKNSWKFVIPLYPPLEKGEGI